MQQTDDIGSLTGLRGVAAVYVMAFHFFAGQPMSNPVTTILAHGYLAVDLFFVLSGFVMALNYAPMFGPGWRRPAYAAFLGRRVARIYPLYAVTTVVAVMLVLAGLRELSFDGSVPGVFVLNMLLVQSWGLAGSLDGPAWSISAEWAAYLLFPVIVAPCLFRRAGAAWAAAAASVSVVALLCVLPDRWVGRPDPAMLLDVHRPFPGLTVLRCLPEFVLGVLTLRLVDTRAGRRLHALAWPAPATCIAIVALLAVPRTDFLVVLLCPVLVFTLLPGHSGPARALASRPLALLGILSFSIYLTHDLMTAPIAGVRQLAEANGWRHGQSWGAGAGAALTVAASLACYRFVERPGRRWLRQVFEGRRPPPILTEPSAP